MSAETTREAPDEQWAEAIEDSRLILDDGLEPADVAEEFDDIGRETMADLCREAVLQVERDRAAVILEDFRAARDVLDADDEDDEEDTPSAGDSLEAMLDDVDGLNDNADSHRDEADGETDVSLSTDSQSSQSSPNTDSPVEPVPSAMDRDALENKVSDNRERIATFEAQVETLQEVANRDVAIMRGALQELLGGDVVDDVSDLPEAAQQFRAEHDRADRAVREGAVSDGGEGNRTKVELATDLAKAEAVRVSTTGLQGGAIDYPDVRYISDRQHDTDLHSGTVYDAFDRLEDRWDCFEVKTGGDGQMVFGKTGHRTARFYELEYFSLIYNGVTCCVGDRSELALPSPAVRAPWGEGGGPEYDEENREELLLTIDDFPDGWTRDDGINENFDGVLCCSSCLEKQRRTAISR